MFFLAADPRAAPGNSPGQRVGQSVVWAASFGHLGRMMHVCGEKGELETLEAVSELGFPRDE